MDFILIALGCTAVIAGFVYVFVNVLIWGNKGSRPSCSKSDAKCHCPYCKQCGDSVPSQEDNAAAAPAPESPSPSLKPEGEVEPIIEEQENSTEAVLGPSWAEKMPVIVLSVVIVAVVAAIVLVRMFGGSRESALVIFERIGTTMTVLSLIPFAAGLLTDNAHWKRLAVVFAVGGAGLITNSHFASLLLG